MVRMNPTGSRYSQKNGPLVAPPLKPLLLKRSPNTNEALWWWEGTSARSRMITSTPSTCQPTEMLLKMPRRRSANMFTTV